MTTAPPLIRASVPLRPFYTSTFIISLLAAYAYCAQIYKGPTDHLIIPLGKREESDECRNVRFADDQCAYVTANCLDDEAGLLPYLTFYYCDLASAQPVAFSILTVWLGLLFTTIGIAASDFFSVNLSTIATILGLSESLAGVTFLAFGNGSPDVFSTFAAMGSNSASMAVGELIGAASFITAVVAGSMALVREFKVGRKTFVRDICFFIVAISFSMVFLADGHLHLWECCVMIAYYVGYVITVVGWHWLSTRRKRKRDAAAEAARNDVSVSLDRHAFEPYRDSPPEPPVTGELSQPSIEVDDLDRLESGPRIEIYGGGMDDEDRERDFERQVATEVASSMRVLPPRGKRRSTITPIRPSLVGALEFRYALAHLQRQNDPSPPAHGRSYSAQNLGDSHPENALHAAQTAADASRQTIAVSEGISGSRERALSSGNIPDPRTGTVTGQPKQQHSSSAQSNTGLSFPQPDLRGSRTPSPSHSFQIDGSLAPPPGPQRPASPSLLHLDISSRRSSASGVSSPISPFPGLTDSPQVMSPHPNADPSELTLTPGPRRDSHFPGFEFPAEEVAPIWWWPYAVLPPPGVVLSTLFPTLQNWADKTIWEKFVSVISFPSIFLLVITLPVVDTETPDDPVGDGLVDPPHPGSPGNTAPPVAVESGAIQPETEWQRYRRRTRSKSHAHRPSHQGTPTLLPLDSGGSNRSAGLNDVPLADQHPAKPLQGHRDSVHTGDHDSEDDNSGWNRWLVALQLFTGPLFAMFILWANMMDDFDEPGKVLLRFMLSTLAASVVLLGILLLTTTADERPRYHFLLCFLGFLISIAWISTIAGEVVGVLKAFGVILGISEALLGLTVFAAGNSVGDLIADITVARLGYPVMALSACFGGPMLNILLGIGIGGVIMMVQSANHRHAKQPDKPVKYKPFKIPIGRTLLVSAVTLLATLVGLLIALPLNKWVMSRKIGWSLITLWTVSTVINVAIELSGVWR